MIKLCFFFKLIITVLIKKKEAVPFILKNLAFQPKRVILLKMVCRSKDTYHFSMTYN
jgi:hypothetical protein